MFKAQAKTPRGSRWLLRKQQEKEPEAVESGSSHFICAYSWGTLVNSKSKAISAGFCI